ncbi:primosomal protein N' [Candidatus Izemoplasma sp. B36]|uniref:primosomal protein N' n=1 Tax=Candidatus Izemoplasma sp. B36 TaxID=3242468 RepID=UPI003558D18E
MIAKVLVDIKSKNVDKTFDYKIPQKFIDIIEVGTRVIVPFGKRQIMGFCLEIKEKSDYSKTLKEIDRVIDMESYLTEELIDLAKQIKEETSSLLIKILETMLPAALKVVYKPKVKLINRNNLNKELLPYFEYSDEILLESIENNLYSLVHNEIKKSNIKQIYDIKSRNKDLRIKYIKLTKKPIEKITEKQAKVINYLKSKKDYTEKSIKTRKELSITASVINTLEKKGYINSFYKNIYRQVTNLFEVKNKEITLNEEQKIAFNRIVESLGTEKIFLLHGVTGSGKTEIYLKAIEETRNRKKSVIFLVPEISLTPMMMARFKAKFGNDVAVLHSGLSTLEKYDEWRRIARNEANIIVGARSACFAPVKDLGLVIIDESHEATYKQDNQPNYYAVDVLKRRIKHFKAVLVLGSATPNIDSYARQARGYYELLTLENRALNAKMPKLEVVDMKKEFISGNSSSFSTALQNQIKDRLNKKEQVILLINRRGHSNFIICRNCGYVFTCEKCDISLTYHEYTHSLKCHYCGHEEKIPNKCKKCGSEELRYMGSGTQKIEQELSALFPDAKVIRMDNDTTRRKNAHEKLLHEFEESGDILLGTQMIAKGLDFPKVTLVGILQADNNLYNPDFRSCEKTFQLIMQVSGRAGRRDTEGKVIIQAFNPEHYAIKYAYNNDYLGFYEHEMRIRRLAKYSPYYFLIQLTVFGSNMRDVFYNGIEIVKFMKRKLNNQAIILGPAVPIVKRINNRYICEIMIKYRELGNLNEILHHVLDNYQIDDNYVSIDRYVNIG